ncbi:MAG: UDP-N-acetylmuramate--L-alanine ligase [Bacteroidetes bacterium]|jgi:UDP-N-acetylmuramate--alanine ligase|nr:UDP-N-acetylmuramate--L-alanine ligase [Bacteroidota bacterium]
MNVLDYKLYYFLGVGGIGMSALARYFNHYGKPVHGYDKTSTVLTSQLQAEGISIHFNEDEELVKELFANYKKEEILVIYTPAVPKEHRELIYLQSTGYKLQKRAWVLGEITKQFRTIAIAGTHGKTTTTTLVTHILKTAGIECFAFLGGISQNYHTNLLLGDASDKDAIVVVEADEYDRSFLTLYPYITVITSVDADHLDIYGDTNSMHLTYTQFAYQVQKDGFLIVKKNVDNDLNLNVKRLIYSLNLDTEYSADSIHITDGEFCYNINSPIESVSDVAIGLPGLHNVENSIAAVAVAQQLGIKGDVINKALRSFKGVKRRFDYRVKTKSVVYIDDYAHHPEELKAAITAAKQLYPDKKVTGIFQPHLFSRTRDFADGFAESLDLLDVCVLLEIYPAREQPIEGINSQMLLDKMKSVNKFLVKKENVVGFLKMHPPEVVMTLGAGDIDSLIEPIEKMLKEGIEGLKGQKR